MSQTSGQFVDNSRYGDGRKAGYRKQSLSKLKRKIGEEGEIAGMVMDESSNAVEAELERGGKGNVSAGVGGSCEF